MPTAAKIDVYMPTEPTTEATVDRRATTIGVCSPVIKTHDHSGRMTR